MNPLLRPEVIHALGETLLHFLWQGLLIGALLELVLVVLRDATSDARYLARCAALGVMAALPPLTLAISLSGAPELPPSASGAAGTPLLDVAPAGGLLFWVVIAWAVGAGFLCLRTAGGWARLWLLRRAARGKLPPRWQATFQRLARELRVRASAVVIDSATVAVPTVIGWLKPVVLVPARVLTGLSEEQIEVLLAHELAHVRRADYLVNLLQSLVEALLFFHPVVWRVSSGIRAEREFCCDDVALTVSGDGVSFARALTELESWRGEQARLAISTLGGSLMHRIQRMVGIQAQVPGRRARVGQALAVLLAAGSLGAAAFGLPRRASHEVHVHAGCARCESAAERQRERHAQRDELQQHVDRARAELAALRELLAAERSRHGETGHDAASEERQLVELLRESGGRDQEVEVQHLLEFLADVDGEEVEVLVERRSAQAELERHRAHERELRAELERRVQRECEEVDRRDAAAQREYEIAREHELRLVDERARLADAKRAFELERKRAHEARAQALTLREQALHELALAQEGRRTEEARVRDELAAPEGTLVEERIHGHDAHSHEAEALVRRELEERERALAIERLRTEEARVRDELAARNGRLVEERLHEQGHEHLLREREHLAEIEEFLVRELQYQHGHGAHEIEEIIEEEIPHSHGALGELAEIEEIEEQEYERSGEARARDELSEMKRALELERRRLQEVRRELERVRQREQERDRELESRERGVGREDVHPDRLLLKEREGPDAEGREAGLPPARRAEAAPSGARLLEELKEKLEGLFAEDASASRDVL